MYSIYVVIMATYMAYRIVLMFGMLLVKAR